MRNFWPYWLQYDVNKYAKENRNNNSKGYKRKRQYAQLYVQQTWNLTKWTPEKTDA